MSNILSAGKWASNAELIHDVAQLNYLDGRVLDMSYGLGAFWRKFEPPDLTTNDINPSKGEHSYNAFIEPPEQWVGGFDSVVWDGPYRLSGARDLLEINSQYGLEKYRSPKKTIDNLLLGVNFGYKCTTNYLLVKCQDQVADGRKRWQTIEIHNHAINLGLILKDSFVLTRPNRPQPRNVRQVHSRSNYSTLMVFKKK